MKKIHLIIIAWLVFLFCIYWVAHFFPSERLVCTPMCNNPGDVCLATESCNYIGKWAAGLIGLAFTISLFLYFGFVLFHLFRIFAKFIKKHSIKDRS